jgi:uncharacterized protein (TIGR02246 family)
MTMSTPATEIHPGERAIRELYESLLEHWNQRDAAGYAALFEEDGFAIGFDGSEHNGRAQIETEIGQIFGHHQTGRYVGKIREIRILTGDVAVLRAVAAIVPPGASEIKPETNAIQTVAAHCRDEWWRIAIFQNTPAQFHGRPELAQALTKELQALVR